jgi:hypothetical protein
MIKLTVYAVFYRGQGLEKISIVISRLPILATLDQRGDSQDQD